MAGIPEDESRKKPDGAPNGEDVADGRADWVEPEVRPLSVSETALRPGVGHDGETIWTDCTLS